MLLARAIQPVQQFSYTAGKNATDSALIIDAMDLLHSKAVNGFCIVSSDSDYTRLATRIREAGLAVYGLGEKKTPQPFVAACDPRNYNCQKLGELVRKQPYLDVKEVPVGDGPTNDHLYVRLLEA